MLCETTSDGDLDATRRRGRWGAPSQHGAMVLALGAMEKIEILSSRDVRHPAPGPPPLLAQGAGASAAVRVRRGGGASLLLLR
jgi:hypothetical protein